MINPNSLAVLAFSIVLMMFAGCGGDSGNLAPVSGIVTHNGKPVPKVLITFSPQPVGENYAPGPYSVGVTGDDGKFTLKTRYDDEGALIGKHSFSIRYSDVDPSKMNELRDAMAEAKEEKMEAEFKDAQKRIKELTKKLKGRPVLKRRYHQILDVPSNGTQDLKLELNELE